MTDDVLEEAVVGEVVADAVLPDLPEDPAEAISVLEQALEEARASDAARLDDLQRVAADFENFRKRAVREQLELAARASQGLVEALLPVLDSFDAAFAHEAQNPGEEQLLAGIKGTFHQLMSVLGAEGLEVIPTVGEAFDPEVHEAVSGGTGDDLLVSGEMRRGYTLAGRVIRPALVSVEPAAPAEEETEESQEE